MVRTLDSTPIDDLTDNEECDSVSLSSTVDLLDVQAMTFACLLCNEQHDPYKCGVLKGDIEAQRKVFANMRDKRHEAAKVQQVSTTDEGTSEDQDLISFDDLELELDFC